MEVRAHADAFERSHDRQRVGQSAWHLRGEERIHNHRAAAYEDGAENCGDERVALALDYALRRGHAGVYERAENRYIEHDVQY